MDQQETHIPVIEAPIAEATENKSSTGSVIAILLIVSLLVVGAFYVWGQRVSERNVNESVQAI